MTGRRRVDEVHARVIQPAEQDPEGLVGGADRVLDGHGGAVNRDAGGEGVGDEVDAVEQDHIGHRRPRATAR